MKKQIILLSSLFIAVTLLIGSTGCKKKTDTTVFALSTLIAQLIGGTIDLNAATPANNVPTLPTIVATYTVGVDPSGVTATSITLIRDYDNTAIELTLTSSGSQIIIVPKVDLGNGALYKLHFNALLSTDGQTTPAIDRTFTTFGSFVPSGQIAYWNFEGNANDQVGTWNPSPTGIVDITYTPSYKTAAGTAATFNGTTSIIEIPNGDQLSNTPSFSLCFWVKTNSAGHVDAGGNPKGHFVIGLGAFKGFQFEIPADYSACKLAAQYELADGTTASEDLWYNGEGLKPDSWQGWTFSKDLTGSGGVAAILKDKWAQVVCTYDGPSKVGTLYLNGEKMKAQDFNLWPAGDRKLGVKGLKWGGVPPEVYPTLAFGFIQSREGTLWATEPWGGYTFPTSNHFGGWLDDVRIYHKALTAVEIDLMYQSEKP